MTGNSRRWAPLALLLLGIGVGVYYIKGQAPPPSPSRSHTASGPVKGGALVATMRGEPTTFNRYAKNAFPTDLIAILTAGRLVRVNRVTDTPEPWLAASWTVSPDTRTITLDLRPGVLWSDGTPFTADDVLFSFAAALDAHFANVMTDVVRVGDAPIAVHAESPLRVVLHFDKPYAPGVRLLDALPIYPKHALGAALAAGTFGSAWGPQTPAAQMPVLGPFMVQSYTPGERVVLARNPHYWRTDAEGRALPYLDTLTLEIAPDQNTELLRLAGGQVDLMQTQLRPDDYREMKAAADAGKVHLVDAGSGFDRYLLWFNLAAAKDSARGFLLDDRFRQAVSLAVSRQGFVDSVYLAPRSRRRSPCRRPTTSGCRPGCSRRPSTRSRPRRCSTGWACSIATRTACARMPRGTRRASRSSCRPA